MRKLVQLALFCLVGYLAHGQQGAPAVVDSFKSQIDTTTDVQKKFELVSQLARVLMNSNPVEADQYGKQLIEMAEISRDRRLMVKAQLSNGERFSYVAGRRDNVEKAISYYTKALELAKGNKLTDLVVSSYIALSEISRNTLENEKASAYINQGFTYANRLKDDSLMARVYHERGSVQLAKSEKLAALEDYFSALRLSEEMKNPYLLRSSYSRLSMFYASIESFDIAIDYMSKSLEQLDQFKSSGLVYTRIQDLNKMGDLYTYAKNYDMSMMYYEKALKLADSIKYEPIKVMSYRSIISNYLESGKPEKALAYYNQHPQLKEFLERLNFGHFTTQSYGYMYMQLGKYDSAKYFYNQVAPFFEKDVNTGNKYNYYYQLGMLYEKTGEYDKSINYFKQASEIAMHTGNLQILKMTTEMLDSVSQKKGDYKQAVYYSGLTARYKDSLDKLGKERELVLAQVADVKQRDERIAREKEETKRRKNNIQYISIVFGILGLFVALVVLGMFKVSAGLIKAIGFFVFLLLFEFIFLVFKKNIYAYTNGEPLKDLLFMIGLAALLVPLHHWLEHRVLHYLTSHNRLTAAGHHIRNKLFRKPKQGEL